MPIPYVTLHKNQGDIAKEWGSFANSCCQSYLYGIKINGFIIFFINDRDHVAACEGIPLSLQAPHHPTIAVMFQRNSPTVFIYFFTVPAHNT